MAKTKKDSMSRPIAFCAMMAALGTVIMLTGGLVPVFTYCSPLLASLLLVPVMEEYKKGYAWMVWAVTGALSLMIGVDKEAAFFYAFLGWYPIIRNEIEKVPSNLLRFCIKLLLFSAAIGAMYALIFFVFSMNDIIETFSATLWVNLAFFAMLAAVMMIFDRTLPGFRIFYLRRIRSEISKAME